METGKYLDEDGSVRWKTDRQYSEEERKKMRDEFQEEAKKGKLICISDLMINHGL